MIEKDVMLRSEVRTVFSSERQERMKVYFQLNERFQACKEKCKTFRGDKKTECEVQCEKVFDEYVSRLTPRYENNKERLDMEVKNYPPFIKKRREGRDNWFWKTFGVEWKDVGKKGDES